VRWFNPRISARGVTVNWVACFAHTVCPPSDTRAGQGRRPIDRRHRRGVPTPPARRHAGKAEAAKAPGLGAAVQSRPGLFMATPPDLGHDGGTDVLARRTGPGEPGDNCRDADPGARAIPLAELGERPLLARSRG
jgi:hypothetical protein